ncbi:MAG: ATP-binding protein, partial [Brachybacterium sp.]
RIRRLQKPATPSDAMSHEWLLDFPDEDMQRMLLELLERRYGNTSTVFCTQYAMKDWHPRVGGGVHADAIMDRIIHNTIWIETGSYNMREHAAVNGA